jgi:hypothetical protein
MKPNGFSRISVVSTLFVGFLDFKLHLLIVVRTWTLLDLFFY